MYRRWKISDQPKEKQARARETANEAALKRDEPAGDNCDRHGGRYRRLGFPGRPVTSAGIAEAPLSMSGASCVCAEFDVSRDNSSWLSIENGDFLGPRNGRHS
jgi:hypothetical protein